MFLADNQVARGRSVLEQAAVEYPQRPEIYVIFGKLALHEGRLTEAWVVMERAEDLAKTFPWSRSQGAELRKDLYAAMAIVAERRGDPAAAGRALSGWLALDPGDGAARRRLGQALFRQGKRADAVKELEQAARDQAGMEPAAITLGQLYSEAKDPAKAAQWMEKAIEEEPRNRKGRLAYAHWLLEQDQPDKARVQAESALELDPAAAEGRLLLGVIQWHLHEYEKAEKILQRLHQESPGSFEASNYLALALAEQPGETRQRQALELAEINARLYPNSSEALETIGRVYYRLGRLDEAEKALRAAVAT